MGAGYGGMIWGQGMGAEYGGSPVWVQGMGA